MIGIIPAEITRPAVLGDWQEAELCPHFMRLGTHPECKTVGASDLRIGGLRQYTFPGIGAPHQAIQQIETRRIARLDHQRCQLNQSA